MLSRELICNLMLGAVILVLLVRRYMNYAEAQQANNTLSTDAPKQTRPAPTPTAIPGPPMMRQILGKCKHLKGVNTMEFCGFRSIKQVTGQGSHYMGFWGKWITKEVNGKKKYTGQMYSNGEVCPGFGNRQTEVTFVCKESAKELELVKDEENDPCKYKVTLAYAPWCEVEKMDAE
jgi:hypothetical protein